MKFKLWLIEDSQSDAELYFSIGHGDFDDESGLEPKYIVWTYLDGRIKTSKKYQGGEKPKSVGTHGILWGHDRVNLTYKGRYEPQTGRLSVVVPQKGQQIPSWLMDALQQKFKYITKVFEF